MATIAQAAAHIDVSQQWFMELVNRGTFKKAKPGGYDLDVIRIAYIKMLRDDRKASEGGGKSHLSEARTRVATAHAETAERKNQIDAGEWCRTDDVIKVVNSDYTNVRERLLIVPGAFVGPPGLTAAQLDSCRVEMKDLIHDALNELSDPNGAFRKGRI
jgi:terminase small subunit / prophage DNA-packing protein